MMHACFQHAFTMQTDPQDHRTKAWGRGKFDRREIELSFIGQQINVSKNDNACHRLFANLRAPTGLGSSVITLPLLKTKLAQKRYHIYEMLAGTTKCVVIVIAPAQAQKILPTFLDLSRAVAGLPVFALFSEEQFASQIAADEAKNLFEHLICDPERLSIIIEYPRARAPKLPGFKNSPELTISESRWQKTSISVAFHRFQFCAMLR